MKLTEVFLEIHSGNHREGPGDNESTKRALSLIGKLPHEPIVLDIGCGPGMQTLILAKETNGRIIAIDTFEPYLKDLRNRSKKAGLDSRITAQNMSMFDINFIENAFDLIWSEGAI
ncbi:class I SAM-dependent methyltransferase [candidate division KSB1 bacterium]